MNPAIWKQKPHGEKKTLSWAGVALWDPLDLELSPMQWPWAESRASGTASSAADVREVRTCVGCGKANCPDSRAMSAFR